MDEAVARSLARWPNVPAVYGWLELDRRGNWRIKGDRISNVALREFIARNYAADERGCWGDFRLYRSSDDRPFSAEDAQLMRDVSALLARGLRRGAVAAVDDADASAPAVGVLMLDDQLCSSGATDSARACFAALNPPRSLLPARCACRPTPPAPAGSLAGRHCDGDRQSSSRCAAGPSDRSNQQGQASRVFAPRRAQ